MVSRTGWWLRGRRREGAPGVHLLVSPAGAVRRTLGRLAGRWLAALSVLGLVAGMFSLLAPLAPASAAVIGPGTPTIPGFVGYVTSSNTELGIGKLPNGTYGLCTDTGAQFPWPTTATASQHTSPETAYLLTHFMDDAIDSPKMAAALWWVVGLTFHQNSQPGAMQARLNEMKAESPAIHADVKNIHDMMESQANKWAAPAGGYTASIDVAGSGPADRVDVKSLGVKSGNQWVPDEKITVTLQGATFDSTGTATWTGRTNDNPMTLVAHQNGPGVVKATVRAEHLANTMYRVWWGGGNTQRVYARGDFDTAQASDETNDDRAAARAKKVDALTGAPLEGAVFRAWVDVNGNQVEEPNELGRLLNPTGPGGFTSRVDAYVGTNVCFREKTAPVGYQLDKVVKCVAAARAGDPVAVLEIANTPGTTDNAFVPLIVRKFAEDNDLTGMIGVTVETAECASGCPAIESHTFTEADFDAAGQFVQFSFSPIYDDGAEYWVRVTNEPPGWEPDAFLLQAQLEPAAAFFYAAITDSRMPVPALSTLISDQEITVGTTITDAVTVTGTFGFAINGHWQLLGPVAPVMTTPPAGPGEDEPASIPTCVGVSWAGAPVAASGDFAINGDGTYTVGEYTAQQPGCFTYSESGDPNGATGPIPWTAPGIVEETTLALHQPTLVTQVSSQEITVGTTITDAVTVTGTGSAAVPPSAPGSITGHWQLFGPLPAATDEEGAATCVGLEWTDAPLAASGDFVIAKGDGTYTVGEYTVEKPGCFTYNESANATTSTGSVPWTIPGVPEETTLSRHKPSLVTQISAQMGAVGTTITDAVTVTGTGGATVTGVWRLLGPVTPLQGPVGITCEGVNWAGAPVAAQGEFTATGDGTYTVGEHTIVTAGCYTYVEDLKGTTTTVPFPETPPGLPSETTLITDNPTIVTQINDQKVVVGDTISDTVTVANTGGATIAGTWWVYGPVKPKKVDGKPSCREVDWTKAKIADTGKFTATGDGTVEGVGEYKVKVEGCYSYMEALGETPTTEPVATLVGIHEETTLAGKSSADDGKDNGSGDNGEDDNSGDGGSGDNGGDSPPLPDTGAPSNMGLVLIGGLALLAGGLALMFLAWQRRGRGAGQGSRPQSGRSASRSPFGGWPAVATGRSMSGGTRSVKS